MPRRMQNSVEKDRMGGDRIRVDAAPLAAMRFAAEQPPLWTLRIVANEPPPRSRLLDMHSTIWPELLTGQMKFLLTSVG